MPKLKHKTILPTVSEDAAITRGIEQDKSNPQWVRADFSDAKPAREFFDPDTYSNLVKLVKSRANGPFIEVSIDDLKFPTDSE